MNDFNNIHALYHSSIAKEEIERRKRNYAVINTDFLQDLPMVVRDVLDRIRWDYGNRSWFVEAWEKYRKMILDAGLGGKIKMPGAVFNEYFDKYELKELEKTYDGTAVAYHSDMYVDDYVRACGKFADEYLAHHGIKGQKWGVRRFQNEDGTLTAKGEKRFGNLIKAKNDFDNAINERNASFENYRKQAKKDFGKDVSKMYPTDQREFTSEHLGEEYVKKYLESEDKLNELGDAFLKEKKKVAGSSYGFFTNMGYGRTNQILKDYSKAVMKKK